jgi:hypothetical protein
VNILNKYHGQTTRGGPTAWGLGVRLTTSHCKKEYCYENSERVSDLERLFG